MEDDERGSMNEGYDENQNMVAGAEMETQVRASSNAACEISPPSREPTPHLAPYVSVFANAPSSHMLPVRDERTDLDDKADAQKAIETDDITEQMTTHDVSDFNLPPPVRNPIWIIDDDDSILSSAPSSPIWPEQIQRRVKSESMEIDDRMGRYTMSAKPRVYSFSLRHTPTKIVSFPAFIINGTARLTNRCAASRTQTGKKSKVLSFPASVINGVANINESRRRNYTGDDMQAALSLANLRCETRLEARDLEAMFAMVGNSENAKKFEGLLRSAR